MTTTTTKRKKRERREVYTANARKESRFQNSIWEKKHYRIKKYLDTTTTTTTTTSWYLNYI
jgi:hypothetical protein